jgi:hypothetical protein
LVLAVVALDAALAADVAASVAVSSTNDSTAFKFVHAVGNQPKNASARAEKLALSARDGGADGSVNTGFVCI